MASNKSMKNLLRVVTATSLFALIFTVTANTPAQAFVGTLENGNLAYAQSSFNTGEACVYLPGFEKGYDAWHYVLTSRGATFQQDPTNPAISINLNMVFMKQDGTTIVLKAGAWVQTGKGAYVYTKVEDRLRQVQSGTMAIIGSLDSGMRLSHTCPGVALTTSTTPTASPTPTASSTSTPTPTVSPTVSATPTVSPTPTSSPTATRSTSPTPTATRSTSPTPTATRSTSPTPTASRSATPSATPTASRSATPSATPTASRSATPSASPTATPTPAPSIGTVVSPNPRPTVTTTATPRAVVKQNSNPISIPNPTASPCKCDLVNQKVTPSPSPSYQGIGPEPSPSTSPSAEVTPTQSATPTPTPASTNSALPTAPASTVPTPPAIEDPKNVIYVEPETPKIIDPNNFPEPPATPITIVDPPKYGVIEQLPDGTLKYTPFKTEFLRTVPVDTVTFSYKKGNGAVVIIKRSFIVTQSGDVPSLIETGGNQPMNSNFPLFLLVALGCAVSLIMARKGWSKR